jgi:hypothetical protein
VRYRGGVGERKGGRRTTPPDLLLDAGNILPPGSEPELSRHILETYRELGYDLVAPGDQELSDGIDAFRGYLAAYPMGSHNISFPGAPALEEPLLRRVGKVGVAVLSLTGAETFEAYPREFREAFTLEEPLRAARRLLARVEPPDHLILLYHGNRLGARRLAKALPEVDAVIYGHEEELAEAELSNGTLLLSPGKHGNRVGRLTLRSRRALFSHRRVDLRRRNRFISFDYLEDPDDPQVHGRIASYEAQREAEIAARLGEGSSRVSQTPGRSPQPKPITVRYYYSPGCKECREFLSTRGPEILRRLPVAAELRRRNVLNPGVYEEFESVLQRAGSRREEFPVAVVGQRMLQGSEEIDAHLETLLTAAAAGKNTDLGTALTPEGEKPPEGVSGGGGRRLSLLPVVAAGLLDGVNPCVFTALLFLVSSMLLVRKERRELILLGGVFLATVYLTYFLAGLGLFAGLRAAEALPAVGELTLAAVFVLLAVMSLRDAWLARKGKVERMALKLPQGMREWLHGGIRGYRRRGAMVGGTVTVGFLITLFELGCTGQIYLPTLAYYARSSIGALSLLAIYNLAFVVPLGALFLLVVSGISLGRVRKAFSKGVPSLRLASALLFGAFAAATVFL